MSPNKFEITPAQTGFAQAVQAAVICRTAHHLQSVRVTEETEFVVSSRLADRMNDHQIAIALVSRLLLHGS